MDLAACNLEAHSLTVALSGSVHNLEIDGWIPISGRVAGESKRDNLLWVPVQQPGKKRTRKLAICSLRLSDVFCFDLCSSLLMQFVCVCHVFKDYPCWNNLCLMPKCWLPDLFNLRLMLLTGIRPDMTNFFSWLWLSHHWVCPCPWTVDRIWSTPNPQHSHTLTCWLMSLSMRQWSHISPDMVGRPSLPTHATWMDPVSPFLILSPSLTQILLLHLLHINDLFHHLSLPLRSHTFLRQTIGERQILLGKCHNCSHILQTVVQPRRRPPIREKISAGKWQKCW